uniref:CDP-diacylglycerol--glycerol-3-phosphate 3-phosphatidyltransferase n=1 Tax=Desulfobacca acetoxidans TaxID=60893 RepID=A0A7C3Z226_9BACT
MTTLRTTYRNLPNLLTVGRILAIPVVMVLLSFSSPWASFLGALAFSIAGATDFLDGFLARRQRTITPFGKFMDPLADKLLVSAALIMLIPLGRVPAWMVVVIVGRELMVTGLRALAAAEGIILAPDRWGKTKTLLQMVAITALILHYPYQALDFQRAGIALLWVAMIVTVTSGVGYFTAFFRQPLPTEKA